MNRLPREKRILILRCLVEGMSIRATARTVEVSPVTVLKLLADAGTIFAAYQDEQLRGLESRSVELDEVWSYIHVKEARLEQATNPPAGAGDVWTWVAICRESKLVPTWRVGDRSQEMANDFVQDLARRFLQPPQVTSDALAAYLGAVYRAFWKVDYAVLRKEYRTDSPKRKTRISGQPDPGLISTSIVERQNLTLRMSVRRFTRRTNAFSKRVANHAHSVALHFMWYNFGRIHQSLDTTPARAAGVAKKEWHLSDLVGLIEERTPPPGPRGPYRKASSN